MRTGYKQLKKRGYCGIAFWEPKSDENVGTVFRNAHCFGVDFISAIGARTAYKQASNTSKAEKHIPVFNYDTMDEFVKNLPMGCELVAVEVDGEPIENFKHPERAIYLFGGEDRTLPIIKSAKRIKINTDYCLNMATTSAVILYDRQNKSLKPNKEN